MTFGDTSRTYVTLSPDPEGWEIRVYNEKGHYWPARLSTSEMMRAVALVMDAEMARKFGRKETVVNEMPAQEIQSSQIALERAVSVRLDTLRERLISHALTKNGVFTAPEIYEEVRRTDPFKGVNHTTVSHALRVAAKRGALEVVEAGAGKRATRYRNHVQLEGVER